jgi:arylformamidase
MIDISWPITSHITEYKDKKTVTFEHVKMFEQDCVRETIITCGAHTGTHIDAPAHFLKNGNTIEQTDLHAVVGECRIVDAMHVSEKITADDIERCDVQSGERILFKTKNSLLDATEKFNPQFVYLTADAAKLLAERKVRTVGIDYLGIERGQPDHATHVTLLQNNVTIIEGLRLAHVLPGRYQLICLPLLMVRLEAAPARAILLRIL